MKNTEIMQITDNHSMGNTLYEVFKANSSNSNLLMSTNQLGQKHIKFSTLILHVIGYGKNKINA